MIKSLAGNICVDGGGSDPRLCIYFYNPVPGVVVDLSGFRKAVIFLKDFDCCFRLCAENPVWYQNGKRFVPHCDNTQKFLHIIDRPPWLHLKIPHKLPSFYYALSAVVWSWSFSFIVWPGNWRGCVSVDDTTFL